MHAYTMICSIAVTASLCLTAPVPADKTAISEKKLIGGWVEHKKDGKPVDKTRAITLAFLPNGKFATETPAALAPELINVTGSYKLTPEHLQITLDIVNALGTKERKLLVKSLSDDKLVVVAMDDPESTEVEFVRKPDK